MHRYPASSSHTLRPTNDNDHGKIPSVPGRQFAEGSNSRGNAVPLAFPSGSNNRYYGEWGQGGRQPQGFPDNSGHQGQGLGGADECNLFSVSADHQARASVAGSVVRSCFLLLP